MPLVLAALAHLFLKVWGIRKQRLFSFLARILPFARILTALTTALHFTVFLQQTNWASFSLGLKQEGADFSSNAPTPKTGHVSPGSRRMV